MSTEYEILRDDDLAYVSAKINAMAKEGWRVHTFTVAAVPASEGLHAQLVINTVLLERETP